MARRCKNCKKLFKPIYSSIQACCTPSCSIEWSKTDKGKSNAKKLVRLDTHKARKEFNEKNKSWWVKKVQVEFNKFIRVRDEDLPCISCGTRLDVQYCAGHYKTRGSSPELRFDELNVNKQCNKNCNLELSGNLVGYRVGLIKKIGLERVEWLEGPHPPKKYTIDDLKELLSNFKLKVKEMER